VGGAHLYVCGDAARMARDVHAALLEIVAEHAGKSTEDANDYLNDLLAQGRYARDVY
jgi:sulfite reductase (NADPH) flavoprotein alpha-component